MHVDVVHGQQQKAEPSHSAKTQPQKQPQQQQRPLSQQQTSPKAQTSKFQRKDTPTPRALVKVYSICFIFFLFNLRFVFVALRLICIVFISVSCGKRA